MHNKLIQKVKYHKIRIKDERVRNRKQIYRRVCCEPSICYKDKKGKIRYYYPDIVVYNDSNNQKDYLNPPDDDEKKKANWPMLWVCEIKYANEFAGSSSPKSREVDKGKIKCLLNYDKGKTEYGWLLSFDRTKPNRNKNLLSQLDKEYKEHLVEYIIRLPKKVNNESGRFSSEWSF